MECHHRSLASSLHLPQILPNFKEREREQHHTVHLLLPTEELSKPDQEVNVNKNHACLLQRQVLVTASVVVKHRSHLEGTSCCGSNYFLGFSFKLCIMMPRLLLLYVQFLPEPWLFSIDIPSSKTMDWKLHIFTVRRISNIYYYIVG